MATTRITEPQDTRSKPNPSCSHCGSKKVWKDGIRKSGAQAKQRYVCRVCGYRFSEPSVAKSLCMTSSLGSSCQIGATPIAHGQLVRNLAAIEPLREGPAGATIANTEGKIIEFLWWMKKQGYKETTILSRGSRLRRLVKLGANLFDPEKLKETIAVQGNWCEARKEAMVYAYDLFAKWQGIKWQRPIYKPIRKLPFIPLEREIDDLIAACNRPVALFLQIAKETGARAGEIYTLEWIDVDLERKTISLTPEKGSNPRVLRISGRLLNMLQETQKKDAKIFTRYKHLNSLRRTFDRTRKRTACNLSNPRLTRITFHTLRHWKATMEYHKTKDILHVMQTLGHKNIKNTLLYTQLVNFDASEEYVCKIAKIPIEIQALIEDGFEYTCDLNELKFFRKRK